MRRFDSRGALMGDFTMNGLLMFVAMVVILLPFINDPRKQDADNIDPPHQGVLRVETFWPDNQHCDVDLWVKGPVGNAVGYSNKGSELWNLLRDDLGVYYDASNKNMETSYTRGIWDGEYIVNLHLYAAKSVSKKDEEEKGYESCQLLDGVPVKTVLYFKPHRDAADQQIAVSDNRLRKTGEEITVFRLMVKDNRPDLSTLNHLHTSIRALKQPARPEENR